MVEGDHIAPVGERAQGVEVAVVAEPGADDHPGGALAGGGGEDAQVDAERDGRLLGHAGELARAHHADDGADDGAGGRLPLRGLNTGHKPKPYPGPMSGPIPRPAYPVRFMG